MVRGRNRREFLKQCCALGAAGAGMHLGRLGMMSAYAQTTPDFKALVCVFLFGGNDSNNTIIPTDSRYNAYRTMRGSVALQSNELLTTPTIPYGFHPRLQNVRNIYNVDNAALVFNVGTLVRPTTKATLGDTPLPRNLYSHSDQTQQWQSSDPNGGSTGWGGRANDIVASLYGGDLPPGVTVNGGNALFLSGPTTQGMNIANIDSFGLEWFGDGTAMNARLASLQRLLTFDSGVRLVGAANGVLTRAINTAQEVNAALANAPEPPVTFPETSLGRQLKQAAQVIAVQGALGMSRQLFFAGMGGFDNHEDLIPAHDQLMGTLDDAIGAFYRTMELRGMLDKVTLFTESEFSRTANSNSNQGSDHAWGGHHIAIGGAVQGGTYGTFPTLQLQGPDDAGDRGYWIPQTSLDQYAATLAQWYGVPDDRLLEVFPNLVNWGAGERQLGFLA